MIIMKFGNDKLELGTRFYKFITDDEYKIFVLVKFDSDDKSAKFMDEETFELITIDEEDLNKFYTMLSDNTLWVLCKFKHNFNDDNDLWLHNEDINQLLTSQDMHCFYKVCCLIRLHVYRFIKKSVFNKMLNYIMNLNNPHQSLSDDDFNTIWDIYFRYIEEKYVVLTIDDDKINMDDVVNNKAGIPDSVFMDAEKLLNTYIISYEVYELDDSVNIYNINMKYFIIYSNDKYYIILYVTDNRRLSRESFNNLNNHIDVVEFMLK